MKWALLGAVAMALDIGWASPGAGQSVPDAITYQGKLSDATGATVPDGTYQIRFRLYDHKTESGTHLIWTSPEQSVSTTGGVFTTRLGPLTPAELSRQELWLEVTIGADAPLPRVQLLSVPYAINNWSLTGNSGTTAGANFLGTNDDEPVEIRVNGARVLRMEPNAVSPVLIGGHSANWVTAGAAGATVAGGGAEASANRATDDYAVVSGGSNNRAGDDAGATSDAQYATVGGGSGNTAAGRGTVVSGGESNFATGNDAVVAGGVWNSAAHNYASVGGGLQNYVTAQYGTVAGGHVNRVEDQLGFVGGGQSNLSAGYAGAITGGWDNSAEGQYSAVGGGYGNSAGSDFSSVTGGQYNTASGLGAAVVGGSYNAAAGDNSVASGRRAKVGATHDGSFLFADQTESDFASAAANEFAVRATGGVRLVSSTGGLGVPASGLALLAGSNTVDAIGTQNLEFHVGGYHALRLQPIGDRPNIIGGFSGNSVTAGVSAAVISGGGSTGLTNRVTDSFGTVVGGVNNQAGNNNADTSDSQHASVGGGSGNTAGALGATVAGGAANSAAASYATVSGGQSNSASRTHCSVGGGYSNSAEGDYAVAAGGRENRSSSAYTSIGGGYLNTASAAYGTVAGGYSNDAAANGGSISGGHSNSVLGEDAAIGGGYQNSADGAYAVVPGGYVNRAGGKSSFAAGSRANATHDGAFVWGDTSAADIASAAANQFIVRASGGIWFGTTSLPSVPAGRFINTSTGAYLSAGGTWTNSCDSALKTGMSLVDPKQILHKLAGMPIATWSYRAEDSGTRHIGPTAQDFRAAFGMGSDDKTIATLDADGVALAAIQGLYGIVQQREAENAELRARVVALERLVLSRTKGVGETR